MTTIMRASQSNPEDDHPYITRSKLLPERLWPIFILDDRGKRTGW